MFFPLGGIDPCRAFSCCLPEGRANGLPDSFDSISRCRRCRDDHDV